MPEKDETCDPLGLIEVAGAALKLTRAEETNASVACSLLTDSEGHSCEVLSDSTFKPVLTI
jgi:hypothetical protein